MAKLGLVLASFFFIASCGGQSNSNGSGELSISFTSKQNYAIDAKGTSCQAFHDYQVAVNSCSTSGSCASAPVLTTGDVAGPYVSFGKMNLTWRRKEPFRVIYVRFSFRSPAISGGKIDYVLADKALWVTWRQGPNYDPPSNPSLPDARDAIFNVTPETQSECDILIPGISVTKRETTTTIPGTATIYGYYELTDGTQIPVFATSDSITATWLGIPN